MSPIRDTSVQDLPGASDGDGERPVAQPLVVHLLAEEWHRQYVEAGNDEKAFAIPGTRFRASWAAGCARATGYRIQENDARIALDSFVGQVGSTVAMTEEDNERFTGLQQAVLALAPTNPPSIADTWRMGLGQMVHDALQWVLIRAMERRFPGAQIEVAVDLRPDVDGSGSVDIVIVESDRTIVVELKTINGFGFKLSSIPFKGPAQGPRYGAKVQGALSAKALEADLLIVGYLSLELLSPDVAKRNGRDEIGRFTAEWHYTPEQFLPWAEAEHKRVSKILEIVDAGGLPPRAIADPEIPKRARITDPSSGAWTVTDPESGAIVQAGKTWWCGYCWQRDRCITDGPT